MIYQGDEVIIKPEYRNAGEENLHFIARSDEENGRVDISALEQKDWPVWPIETIQTNMVYVPYDGEI